MAKSRALARIKSLSALCAVLATGCAAAPGVAFPFNSQVPTVARVDKPYLFQLSSSTFSPGGTNFTYSLSDQPAWLVVDSATRTLSGTPGQADAGAGRFTLTAANEGGEAHMTCILVVSDDPAPQLEGDVSKQLAATTNLSSTEPPVVTIIPLRNFHFQFQQNSFIDMVQRKLYYYATMADHTPLPAWLLFDAQSLIFSGRAPDLSAFPQAWDIQLIASDVAGFSGAIAGFTIAVANQQLVFVPEVQSVNITGGVEVRFTALQNELFLNGANVSPDRLASARASPLPSWLSFDPSTLSLTGTAPPGANNTSVTVSVQDKLGDVATATVNLVTGPVSLFRGSIGLLSATAGQVFNYHFPDSLFSQQNLELSITLPATDKWLSFNAGTRHLGGAVPTATRQSTIQATLTARSPSSASIQTQVFHIDIKASTSTSSTTIVTSSISTTDPGPTNTTSPSPSTSALSQPSRTGLRSGIIAAAVILSVVAAALLAACFLCCYRRRRRPGHQPKRSAPSKRIISRPIQPTDAHAINVATTLQVDIEKNAEVEAPGSTVQHEISAPQIALSLPSETDRRKSRWINRVSHASQVSSLGAGEDAVRADSNIPEWGRQSAVFQAPHDSFSVPAEMARVSQQLSDISPSKRALKRLRERNKSRQSVGLGIDTAGAGLMPRHSSRQSRRHGRGSSSVGLSAVMDRSSQVSLSTRGTSVLSTRPSDFPRPPTRSTCTMSRSNPTLSFSEPHNRKSIRMVHRSDSIADDRSMHEKRQSFIHNRASTSWQSPLFAHGSRASVNGNQSGHRSAHGVSLGSMRRSRNSRNSRNMLATYSESSSLEPYGRNSRRLSQRVRSTFAPNFPRAITKSSLGADDEGPIEEDESGSGFETTSSSISESELVDRETTEPDFVSQLTLPRHQRGWVLPGEASPTPPPAPPASRLPSSARHSTPTSGDSAAKQKWKAKFQGGSPSPLSTAVAVPLADQGPPPAKDKASQARRSRLSEPLSLVSTDSVNRARMEKPRLIHNNSKRPVSVEEVKRLSSLRAETGTETDTQAGSEVWEDLEGSGLMPPAVSTESKANTQRSDASGPAFL